MNEIEVGNDGNNFETIRAYCSKRCEVFVKACCEREIVETTKGDVLFCVKSLTNTIVSESRGVQKVLFVYHRDENVL